MPAYPEGVIYRHSVESFVQRVLVRNNLLTPAVARELTELGVDPLRPRDVPVEPWMKALRRSAQLLCPGVAEGEALEQVGREVFRGYAESFVGRGILLVMRLLGPRKALLRIMESYRAADNVTQVTTSEVTPTHIHLEFNSVGGAPTYVKGIVSEALVALGVPQHTVTFTPLSGDAMAYDVKW